MPKNLPDNDSTKQAEESLAPELDGQATTVEEAMDAATDEEGYVDESAYTTPAGSTAIDEGTIDVDDVTGPNGEE